MYTSVDRRSPRVAEQSPRRPWPVQLTPAVGQGCSSDSGLLSGHQELGCLGAGLQGVGGDHHPCKVQARKQRSELGDLLGGAADLALRQHRAGGVIHAGQQMHRAAVTVRRVGAEQSPAVDGYRSPIGCWSRTVPIPVVVPVG